MMKKIDFTDKKKVRLTGYKILIEHLGFDGTIKFMQHFYEKEKQPPDITWQECFNEIKQMGSDNN